MWKLWIVPLCCLSLPARAQEDGARDKKLEAYELKLKQITLTARLCTFTDGLKESKAHPSDDIEKPETFQALIDFTRKQFDEIKRKPLPCKDKWVRQARACLSSVLGKLNTPLGCTQRPLAAFFQTDQDLPMLDIPSDPAPTSKD